MMALNKRKGMRTARYVGIGLVILLVAGFLHQLTEGFDADYTLLIIAVLFAVVHAIAYLVQLKKHVEIENK